MKTHFFNFLIYFDIFRSFMSDVNTRVYSKNGQCIHWHLSVVAKMFCLQHRPSKLLEESMLARFIIDWMLWKIRKFAESSLLILHQWRSRWKTLPDGWNLGRFSYLKSIRKKTELSMQFFFTCMSVNLSRSHLWSDEVWFNLIFIYRSLKVSSWKILSFCGVHF